MSATQFFYLQGKAKWFKSGAPNKFGKWSHDLYLNAESLETFKKLKEKDGETDGIMNTIKKDEDGYYVTLSRPTQAVYAGKVKGFAPPDVFDKDGKTPLRDILVGNGSDVTTKIEMYTYKKTPTGRGKAIRWLSTKIDTLILFESQRDFDPETARAAKGLDEQPEQLF